MNKLHNLSQKPQKYFEHLRFLSVIRARAKERFIHQNGALCCCINAQHQVPISSLLNFLPTVVIEGLVF